MAKSLDEQIDEDIKAAQEADEKEDDAPEVEDKPEDEPEAEEPADESEDQPAEETEEKPEPKQTDAQTQAALAALRFQISELKREKQLSQPKPEPVKEEKPAPDPNEDPVGYVAHQQAAMQEELKELRSWKANQDAERNQQQSYSAAVNEFQAYENRFKATVPDYDAVSAHMEKTLKQSIKHLNPNLSADQVNKQYADTILQMGAQAVRQGYDPASYVYAMTKANYGYTEPQPEKQPERKTPKLEVIDKNRSKAKHGLGGQPSKGALSIADIEKMTVAEMQEHDAEIAEMVGGFR